MRHHQIRTLARWALQFGPGLIICALVALRDPESPAFYLPILLYVPLLAVLATMVVGDYRGGDALRAASSPRDVTFVTQNLPIAIVHLDPFLTPAAGFPRGRTFVVRADDDGVSYFTPGGNPERFVRIPWSQITRIGEVGGELCIWLRDADLLHFVPGGLLPVSVRRVRVIAKGLSARQPQRQL